MNDLLDHGLVFSEPNGVLSWRVEYDLDHCGDLGWPARQRAQRSLGPICLLEQISALDQSLLSARSDIKNAKRVGCAASFAQGFTVGLGC